MATEAIQATDAAKKRPSRMLRFLVFGLIAMILLVWLAPWLVGKSPLRHVIAQHIFSNLKGEIVIGEASLGWFSPFVLHEVVVQDSEGRSLLLAPKIESSHTLLALLLDRTDLGSFYFEKPALDIVFSSTTSNFEEVCADWFAPSKSDPPREGSHSRPALKVEFREARAKLRDEPSNEEVLFEPVRLVYAVPVERTAPVTLTIEGKQHGVAASGIEFSRSSQEQEVAGQLQNGGEMSLGIAKVPLSLFASLLRRHEKSLHAQGQLDGSLSYRWGRQKPGDDDSRVEGRLNIRNFVLASEALSGDRVQLENLELPCKLSMRGDRIQVEHAELKCDLGQVSVAGSIEPGKVLLEQFSQPGWNLTADIDLARLANMLPRTLCLQEDTRIQSGRLTMKLHSRQTKEGTEWTGDLKTTDLDGTAHGTKLVWKAPLAVAFRGHRIGNDLPVVDELRCDSGFLTVNAAGSGKVWNAGVSFDLDRLSAELSRFIDLGSSRLAGRGSARLTIRQGDGQAFIVQGDSQVDQFELAGLLKQPWKESSLKLRLDGTGKLGSAGHHSLEAADLRLQSGTDELELRLLEPIADVQAGLVGKAHVRVRGDLARWQHRLNIIVPGLDGWKISGTGDVAARLHSHVGGLEWSDATAALRELDFTSSGMRVARTGRRSQE